MNNRKPAYRVAQPTGALGIYLILRRDGTAVTKTFRNIKGAIWLATELNSAYELGRESAGRKP